MRFSNFVDEGAKIENSVKVSLDGKEASTELKLLARQGGIEPPADCLEGSCSIRLSYWRL